MSWPLAYHITWTTYGSWLPGDVRGWVADEAIGIQPESKPLLTKTSSSLRQEAVVLSDEERKIVHDTIEEHCGIRGWKLHAVNVRTNHVHCVITAPIDPDTIATQLKAWCSRRLNERRTEKREHWWTRDQSTKFINDDVYLQTAIHYVVEGQ